MGDTSARSLLAGATAGAVCDAIVYPLDTIKTRVQAPGGLHANGGLSGLYRGVSLVLVSTIPSAGVFFYAYENAKDRIPLADGPVKHLLASSAAEVLSCAILTPAELAKQRSQTSQAGGSPMRELGRLLHGIVTFRSPQNHALPLVAGFRSMVLRNVPVTALQFALYEDLRQRWKARRGGAPLAGWQSGICAMTSGSFAALVTTPIDAIKTRLMLSAADEGGSSSVHGMFARVYRESGVRGLMRGALLRTAWTGLGLGLYLGSYEQAKIYFAKVEQLNNVIVHK